MSDMLRITGMVSGMDTDTTVKKLIQAEQNKVDAAKQDKQYLEWQKEDYREIANVLRGFQDEYFDYLNPENNIRSTSTFNMFSGTATVAGVASSAVSISTSASAVTGSFTINEVTKLATKDSFTSSSEVLGKITSEIGDIDLINAQLVKDNTMSFTFDGITKEITIEKKDGTYAELASDLTANLQEVFTNVDIVVTGAGDQLEFNVYEKGTTDPEIGHSLTVNGTNSDLLNLVGLKSGQSDTVDVTKTLAEVFGKSEDSALTINGKVFSFNEDTKISAVINEINSSNAGVTLSYDKFSDSFKLESNTAGTDNTITINDDTGGLIADFKLVHDADSAENAEFIVNGVTTTRSSNTFEVNGVSVTLNEITDSAVTVNITSDTTEVKDLIVKFVDGYNKMISTINEKVSERRDNDYKPLTEAQKKDMSDDQIESWEKQARKGTLGGDRSLERLTQSLRNSLYESIDGLGISLYDIGITTSNNYKEGGKLIIDEDKLDTALKDRPNEVIELFTKQSEISYASYTDRGTRNSENGIASRMYDILQDNIRLTRDTSNNKGYLIDKAGLDSGVDTTSELAKKLTEMDEKIDSLLELLGNQEEKYYQQFARMESAMASLSAQGDWLTSQFGG
ncbi:MAG: flagellar filament capping protein FliD [Clostridiales bacterium]|nr:flagellar filament capping protein FliD [Clostridiales bacterium]